MKHTRKVAVVVGASGGIGSALVARLRALGRYDRVICTCRTPSRAALECDEVLTVDLENADAITIWGRQLAALINEDRLETVCLCVGLLHDGDLQPERRLASLQDQAFHRLMAVNALGPLLLAQQVVPLLPRKGRSRLLAISARVGSISDNQLGGWIGYRASKAALNQGFKTLSIELRRTHPECVVTLYHPGTVATALSAPFLASVPAERLFTPLQAAQYLCDVLHERDRVDGPLFVDWAGQPIGF